MQITDIPVFSSRESYRKLIDRIVNMVLDSNRQNIRSIFQIGGVNDPGISDLDLLLVVEDGKRLDLNVRQCLADDELNILTHDLYGVSESWFRTGLRYSFFHNYSHLYGEEIDITATSLTPEQERALKKQIALEYLVKMYISTSIEKTYGILRLRSFMLHVKALLYDLEFLDIDSGKLHDQIIEVIEWRRTWFENPRSRADIRHFYSAFYNEFSHSLGEIMQDKRLVIPREAASPIQFHNNMQIVPADRLQVQHHGFTLPSMFYWLGKKYFNVQHRFNDFRFDVPCTREGDPILFERFSELRGMSEYNRKHLRNFMPMSSSLAIF